jgi:hypothetical protein
MGLGQLEAIGSIGFEKLWAIWRPSGVTSGGQPHTIGSTSFAGGWANSMQTTLPLWYEAGPTRGYWQHRF